MSNRIRFIYNPYAGENKILHHLDYVIDQYQQRGYTVLPYRLTGESGFPEAFRGVQEECRYVLVAGGDGTVNGAVNYMKKNGIDLPIAVLPAGTANDFAKLLGLSSNLKTACREILDGMVEEVDLGRANDSFFVNVLSAGLFTDVSQKTPTAMKNTFGKLAYYFSSVQELPNFRKIHIRIDSDEIVFDDSLLIIFVFNGRTAGNMNFAYRSNVQDGLLDVLIIKGDNVVDTIKTVFHFLSGNETRYPRGVVHFKSRRLHICSDDNVSVDIDGESGPFCPLTVSCLERGLKVIIPRSKQD